MRSITEHHCSREGVPRFRVFRSTVRMASQVNRQWVSWDREKENIDQFLKDWKPSCTRSTHRSVKWLCISRHKAEVKCDIVNTLGLKCAWDALCVARQNSVSKEDLENLAIKHNVLHGKWLIFLGKDLVDKEWGRVAKDVLMGLLGSDAKVSAGFLPKCESAKKPRKKIGKGKRKALDMDIKPAKPVDDEHVLCVYSENFTDVIDVFRVRESLKLMGFEKRLQYKPDAYIACGLYYENIWNLSHVAYYG